MILEFIHLGQYSASHPQKGKILKPEQLWPKLNRKSFTEIFIEKSNEIFKNNENKFIALTYNSLAIDAWSIQGVHYLEIVLVNGLLNLPPLLMASFSNFLDTTNTYKEAIQSILLSLSSKKIVIGCCVSDNLRRQVAAISGGSQQSLQNDYDFQKIFEGAQALQHVRCACHTLQLAITDAIHENTDFAEIRDRVEKLGQLFHDDQIAQALGTKSPTFSITRWNSLFIVILWFSTHSEKIIDLLTNNIRVSQLIMDKLAEHKKEIIQFLVNDLIIIYISLISFYRATEILESDNLSIGYVYSIISMAIYKSQQIINSLQIETALKFIDCLSRNISQRFFEYSPDNIFILAHSLTPFGRNQFRRTIDFSSLGGEVSYLDSEIEQPSFTFSPLLIEAFENILKLYYSGEIQISILENKATEQNNSLYIEMNFDSDETDNLYDPFEYEYDDFDDKLFPDSLNENEQIISEQKQLLMKPIIFNEMDKSNFSFNVGSQIENCVASLNLIAVQLDLDCSRISDNYITYLLGDTSELLFSHCYRCNLKAFWDFVNTNTTYHDFSCIAKRILSCTASEACVERRIKVQKQIAKCFNRNRTSKKLQS